MINVVLGSLAGAFILGLLAAGLQMVMRIEPTHVTCIVVFGLMGATLGGAIGGLFVRNQRRAANLLMETRRLARIVAEHKRLEEELLESQDELEMRVQERTRALQESQAQYKELFDNANDIIYTQDFHGNYLSANRAVERILGYKPEEVVTFDYRKVVDPAQYAALEESFAAMLKDPEASGTHEVLCRAKDGTAVWLEVGMRVIRENGRLIAIQGTARDITARKKAEQALKESEERFRQLYDNAPVCYQSLDESGRLMEVNQAWCDMLGYDVSEAVGKPFSDFVVIEDRPTFSEQFARLRSDGQIRQAELVLQRNNGSVLAVALDGRIERDDQGTIRKAYCAFYDLTERKRAEELLLQTERLTAVGELATGVAHNFNNLLQIIIGEAGIAQSSLRKGDLAKVEVSLQQIVHSARLGSGTVRRLQDVARIRSETVLGPEQVFDLSETAQKAVEISETWWRFNYERRGMKIVFSRDMQPGCLVRGSEDELFEVLLNLIKNAIEALPAGGEITTFTLRDNAEVVLSVRDTGTGIAPDRLDKIFQPFWTSKGPQATGMGLASSLSIVRSLGGDISVKSEKGKGSLFTVRLPFSPQKNAKKHDPASTPSVATARKILVIDDMEAMVTMLEEGLKALGQDVLTALSGEVGIELFRTTRVDLVICDLGMPGMNGWEVGRILLRICRERGLPKVPFVLLTGWGGQVIEQRCIEESGVDVVVEKPIDLTSLLKVIEDLTKDSGLSTVAGNGSRA